MRAHIRIAFLFLIMSGSGCAIHDYIGVSWDTEEDIVRWCGVTPNEARRWLNDCRTRSLKGETYGDGTGACLYTGEVYGFHTVTKGSTRVVSTNCTPNPYTDFACAVTGETCSIDYLNMFLPAD